MKIIIIKKQLTSVISSTSSNCRTQIVHIPITPIDKLKHARNINMLHLLFVVSTSPENKLLNLLIYMKINSMSCGGDLIREQYLIGDQIYYAIQ